MQQAIDLIMIWFLLGLPGPGFRTMFKRRKLMLPCIDQSRVASSQYQPLSESAVLKHPQRHSKVSALS